MDAVALTAALLGFLLLVHLGGRIVRADHLRSEQKVATDRSGRPLLRDEGTVEVVLDVGYGDPDSPAVGRLTAEAASRVLSSRPKLQAVRVMSRDRRLLGLVRREVPAPVDVSVSLILLEPRHRPHPHVPSVSSEEETAEELIPWQNVTAERSARSSAVRLRPPEPVHRTLTQEFDVPQQVRQLVQAPNDLVDLIRATLEAADLRVQVDGGMIKAGNTAVVVVASPRGSAVTPHMLNHAYLQFQASGAASGLVLTLGLMDHKDVGHREMFVPALRHAGPEGIQRMLDAVALGGEPLRFALAPPLPDRL